MYQQNAKIDKKAKESPQNSLQYLSSFIIFENFFFINRSYLLHSKIKKSICNLIFYTMIFVVLGTLISDLIEFGFQFSAIMALQVFIVLVLVFFAYTARWPDVFEAIDRLDHNCASYLESMEEIQRTVFLTTLFCIASSVWHVISLYLCSFRRLNLVLTAMLMSVYDSELYFLFLVIKSFNIRLGKLEDASPLAGTIVYKHLILATFHFVEDFNARILLLLFLTITKTIIFTSLFVLVPLEMVVLIILIVYQVKSIYVLSHFCLEGDNSRGICNRLAFKLATKLISVTDSCKKNNTRDYLILKRWYLGLVREKPRYMGIIVDSIGLVIPFVLFDFSINNMLIIVQIYAGYISTT